MCNDVVSLQWCDVFVMLWFVYNNVSSLSMMRFVYAKQNMISQRTKKEKQKKQKKTKTKTKKKEQKTEWYQIKGREKIKNNSWSFCTIY